MLVTPQVAIDVDNYYTIEQVEALFAGYYTQAQVDALLLADRETPNVQYRRRVVGLDWVIEVSFDNWATDTEVDRISGS